MNDPCSLRHSNEPEQGFQIFGEPKTYGYYVSNNLELLNDSSLVDKETFLSCIKWGDSKEKPPLKHLMEAREKVQERGHFQFSLEEPEHDEPEHERNKKLMEALTGKVN